MLASRIAADGDLLLADGRIIRFAGILWPGPDDRAGRERIRAAVDLWISGANVLIAPQGKADRWGRLAAQVFSDDPGGAPVWLQGMLLENGYAAAWPDPEAKDCWASLKALEAGAAERTAGRWSLIARRVHRLRLNRSSENALTQRFVFEARVRSVRQGRRILFINFAGKRQSVPYLSLSQRLVEEFRKQGLDPATFSGKRLRVRAALVRTGAPRLEVSGAQSIDVVE